MMWLVLTMYWLVVVMGVLSGVQVLVLFVLEFLHLLLYIECAGC